MFISEITMFILKIFTFFYFSYLQGFAPHPTSFATEGSACGIGTKKQKDCIFIQRYIYYFIILYIFQTCKTKAFVLSQSVPVG